jgi:hypothetical protein
MMNKAAEENWLRYNPILGYVRRVERIVGIFRCLAAPTLEQFEYKACQGLGTSD